MEKFLKKSLHYFFKCLPHANLKITSHPRQKMLPSAAETPEKLH